MGTMMMLIILVFSAFPTIVADVAIAQDSDEVSGSSPEEIWSLVMCKQVHPWGGDDRAQFKAYHSYFTLREDDGAY